MKTKLFSVRDSKSEAYLPPLNFRSRGEAIRAFSASANDVNHNFNRYAEDFFMFEIGEFDDETGFISVHAQPIALGSAVDFKNIIVKE